jgi:tetratricopeptide (TPR) repeat protein
MKPNETQFIITSVSLKLELPISLIVLFALVSISYAQIITQESSRSPAAKEHREKGIEYGAIGEYEHAKQQFIQALEADQYFLGAEDCLRVTEDVLGKNIEPDIALHLFKGSIYGRKGNVSEELADFERALSINTNYALTHASLGLSYAKKGMNDQAIAHFKKAVAINTNLASAHFNLASVYIVKHMWDEAIAHCRKVLAINPNVADAHNSIGMAYLGKNIPSEVIPPCKKAIAIDPNYAAAHNNLAVAYYYTREYNLAIKHCDRAIELGAPVHPGFLNALKQYRK